MPSSAHEKMAAIAQLGERQTEDLKVPGSIPGLGKFNRMISTVRASVNARPPDPADGLELPMAWLAVTRETLFV